MKAIYLNLDPYLAAVAAWLNAGKPGTAPSFDPLPVAVTIPLGETAVFFEPINSDGGPTFVVDSQNMTAYSTADPSGVGDTVASNVPVSLSVYPPQSDDTRANLYTAKKVTADSISFVCFVGNADDEGCFIPFTVLVRRETASGPVDLVDFTPPAAAIAAGTDLKGTKFNGNEIVAAAGTGALSAPAGS